MLQIAQGLSLDVISKCALAWKVNCQTNTTDPLLRAMHSVVDDAENTLIQYAIALPILRKIAEWIYPYASYYKITTKILDNVREVIEYRRSGQGSRTTDMLQLMLDAQAGKEAKATTSSKGDMLIEDRHLLSNSFLFLAAGFDTTALTLAFGAFLLAKYPEEQERVFNEIVSVFSEPDTELTYDGIQKLKRLDMLIAETMRLYPPVVLFVSRCCRQDTTIMGQFIPAGVNVLVPTWHVHHDPNLWPDPYRFDPERFADGRNTHHPAAYLPFGLGPRGCIGKRFALLEIKMAMYKGPACWTADKGRSCRSEDRGNIYVRSPGGVQLPKEVVCWTADKARSCRSEDRGNIYARSPGGYSYPKGVVAADRRSWASFTSENRRTCGFTCGPAKHLQRAATEYRGKPQEKRRDRRCSAELRCGAGKLSFFFFLRVCVLFFSSFR
ncbi:putative cytochrome P450 [Ixodes scapularis]